jgi:hypothetical protein
MCFFHFLIVFFPLIAISLYVRQTWNIWTSYQWNLILFLGFISLEQMVKNRNLIDHLALRVKALFYMFSHILNDSFSLPFNEVHVLLFAILILIPFKFVFNLVHCVGCQILQLAGDLLLHVVVVLNDLGHLVDFDILFNHLKSLIW